MIIAILTYNTVTPTLIVSLCIYQTITSWWFQPISKNCEKIKKLKPPTSNVIYVDSRAKTHLASPNDHAPERAATIRDLSWLETSARSVRNCLYKLPGKLLTENM